MKKYKKRILITFTVLLILSIGVLGIAGNYLYNLALNPASDKSMVFGNSETKNGTPTTKESTFFQDTKYSDEYIENEGLKLHAYNFKQDSNVYVINVHGYTSQGSDTGVSSEHFYKEGYNVLAVDCRAHGLSQGDYIGMGWDDRKDILAWINFLIEQNPKAEIVLFGVSMGAATIMNTTGEPLPSNVKVAIEDCGYTTTRAIFTYQLNALFGLPDHPFMDAANVVTMVRAGFDLDNGPIQQVSKSSTPTLFIHGSDDKFVPFAMLDELYNKSSAPKEKLIIPNAGHAQSMLVDEATYWSNVDAWIAKYLTN